jgi:sulfur carrier protein ThiS adenylyltransferase
MPTNNQWMSALENRHGKILQEKFSAATVAICGLGGLGSCVALALARVGIGRLILIDFDIVDLANIHRQQYKINQIGMHKVDALAENILEASQSTEIISYCEKITDENYFSLLSQADIICECFDNPEAKAMLVDSVLDAMPQKYIVAASGMAGMESPNSIQTRKITNHFYLCGDGESEVDENVSLFAPRVMLCAAHQAQTILRIIAEKF